MTTNNIIIRIFLLISLSTYFYFTSTLDFENLKQNNKSGLLHNNYREKFKGMKSEVVSYQEDDFRDIMKDIQNEGGEGLKDRKGLDKIRVNKQIELNRRNTNKKGLRK